MKGALTKPVNFRTCSPKNKVTGNECNDKPA